MTGVALPFPQPGYAGFRARVITPAGPLPAGLAALLELINDVLRSTDTHRTHGTHGTHRPFGPAGCTSVETTPVGSRPGHGGGSGGRAATARPRPGPGAATAGANAAATTDAAEETAPVTASPDGPEPAGHGADHTDADHTEVWQLVTRAQGGDGEAFGLLYDRYVDTVFRFIYYRVNDRALAEDFTSETFLRALRRIGTISYQGRDIGAWFITIARNIVLDHVKSARNRLEITTADTIEAREPTPNAESPESSVLRTLDAERLMRAVAELGDEQRECVMLRFINGMSVSETAAIMGKNDGAIKALQHRAVRKLAELLGGELH